jgi:hypothetical protein
VHRAAAAADQYLSARRTGERRDLIPAEHDAIMAGLRLLQAHIIRGDVPDGIDDIGTNGGIHALPTPEALDTLCQAINTEDYRCII